MNHFFRIRIGRFFVLLLCVGFGGILVSCGGDGADEESGWTVQEEALTLEQDLLAGDDEEFYFGSITDLAVRADGRVYVGEASHVKVLAPDGTLQETIGQQGQGPGEFQRLDQLEVARGDSLYVLDSQRRRVSVFTPSGQLARGVSVDPKQGFPELIMVPQDQSGLVLLHETLPVSFSEDAEHRTHVFRRLQPDGSVAHTIVTKRHAPQHAVEQEETKMLVPIPFTPSLHAAQGPNQRIYLARGDSLTVVSYGLNGGFRSEISIPFEPVPVTNEDKERVLKKYSDEQMMPQDKIPPTKPTFTDFLVDDEGRYWFGRPTADPDSTDWWVAWPDQKRVVTTTLPSTVQLEVVTDGRAYGQTTTEEGAPAVVRYRIRLKR